jgi:hypothetical protein
LPPRKNSPVADDSNLLEGNAVPNYGERDHHCNIGREKIQKQCGKHKIMQSIAIGI